MQRNTIGILLGWIPLLLGSVIIAFILPWQFIFSDSLPTGGDIPGHLYLVKSLHEAFFVTGSVHHYAFGFWSGFSLFTFYFPAPYLLSALLVDWLGLIVSFKLVAIFPLLLTPFCFACTARILKTPLLVQGMASLLGVSWLLTDAHVMWGGNASSTLSGMIAQGYAMPIALPAVVLLLLACRDSRFSIAAVLLAACAVLSHFYAIVLLCFVAVAFIIDTLLPQAAAKNTSAALLRFFLHGFCIMVMTLWWTVPLLLLLDESSSFGGHWSVEFLETVTFGEQVLFFISMVSAIRFCFQRERDIYCIRPILIATVLADIVFLLSTLSPWTAFNNIRLWPILYLLHFLLLIAVVAQVFTMRRFLIRSSVVVALCVLLAPSSASLHQLERWAIWNFGGVESKEGGGDFTVLIAKLKTLPASRVSAESNDDHTVIFGSVRIFELIPALTEHEFVEGSIVNSAQYPGIPYFLQCLTSTSCAGWPPGSLMPEFDAWRAVSMMRSVGVRYHIARNGVTADALLREEGISLQFRGSYISLLEVEGSSLITAYDTEAPSIAAEDERFTILQLPRWDIFRENPLAFVEDSTQASVSADAMLQLLASEWLSGRRTKDRGFSDRFGRRAQFRNMLLLPDTEDIDLDFTAARLPRFFIADRPFESVLFNPSMVKNRTPIFFIPHLFFASSFDALVESPGFRKWENPPARLGDDSIAFLEDGALLGGSIDIHLQNQQLVLPTIAPLEFPRDISNKCMPRIEKSINQLRIFTDCPGRPHLLRYSFSRQMQSKEVLRRSTNGFILMNPTSRVSTITIK